MKYIRNIIFNKETTFWSLDVKKLAVSNIEFLKLSFVIRNIWNDRCLNIEGKLIFGDSVVKIKSHMYDLYAMMFGHDNEIKIPIQQQDLFLPYKSFFFIEGRLTLKRRNDKSEIMFGNNNYIHVLNYIITCNVIT